MPVFKENHALGQPLLTNSFLIPRWGGIVIKNPPRSAVDSYKLTRTDLQPIMKTFLSQLRGLIGVKDLDVLGKVFYKKKGGLIGKRLTVSLVN